MVLDASVIARWFGPTAGPSSVRWRSDFEAGELEITVPALLFLELVNVASRQWRWTEDRLVALARRLEDAGFLVLEPRLDRVASRTARGLTAYDACYVTVAEERGVPLITHDRELLAKAADIARPVSER